MNTSTELDINSVRAFWDEKPCQADLSQAEDRRRYSRRFRSDATVVVSGTFRSSRSSARSAARTYSRSAAASPLRTGICPARANYIGTDLTPHGIELARERFQLFGVPGRFAVANAEERIPLPDASVDHVYSFGVIHHAPAPERIIREMHRVLRPGGTFTVMLYNRNSINYYLRSCFCGRSSAGACSLRSCLVLSRRLQGSIVGSLKATAGT